MAREFTAIGYELHIGKDEGLEAYLERVLQLIYVDADVVMFPEYSLGRDVLDLSNLEQLVTKWEKHPTVILGTAPTLSENKLYNTIIVITPENKIIKVAKRFPVKRERETFRINTAIIPPKGFHDNVIDVNGFRVGVIVCSDMWRNELFHDMVSKGAEVICVTSMTVVDEGLQNYAKTQWHALVVVRSREFVVPMVVVDNPYKGNGKVTGKVTCAVDPSKKHAGLQALDDFLVHPQNGKIFFSIDLDRLDDYRNYRDDEGMRRIFNVDIESIERNRFQKKSSKES